jgi:hypothetical protein
MVDVTEIGLKSRGERLPEPLGMRYRSESPKEKGAVGVSEMTSMARER